MDVEFDFNNLAISIGKKFDPKKPPVFDPQPMSVHAISTMIKNKVPKKFQKPAHTWNLLIYLTKYVKFYPDNVKEAPEDKMHDVIAWPEFCREKVAPQIVNSIMKLRSLLPDEFLADSNPDKKKVVKIRHAEKKQIADLAVDFSIMLFAKGYKGYRAALSDFVDAEEEFMEALKKHMAEKKKTKEAEAAKMKDDAMENDAMEAPPTPAQVTNEPVATFKTTEATTTVSDTDPLEKASGIALGVGAPTKTSVHATAALSDDQAGLATESNKLPPEAELVAYGPLLAKLRMRQSDRARASATPPRESQAEPILESSGIPSEAMLVAHRPIWTKMHMRQSARAKATPLPTPPPTPPLFDGQVEATSEPSRIPSQAELVAYGPILAKHHMRQSARAKATPPSSDNEAKATCELSLIPTTSELIAYGEIRAHAHQRAREKSPRRTSPSAEPMAIDHGDRTSDSNGGLAPLTSAIETDMSDDARLPSHPDTDMSDDSRLPTHPDVEMIDSDSGYSSASSIDIEMKDAATASSTKLKHKKKSKKTFSPQQKALLEMRAQESGASDSEREVKTPKNKVRCVSPDPLALISPGRAKKARPGLARPKKAQSAPAQVKRRSSKS